MLSGTLNALLSTEQARIVQLLAAPMQRTATDDVTRRARTAA